MCRVCLTNDQYIHTTPPLKHLNLEITSVGSSFSLDSQMLFKSCLPRLLPGTRTIFGALNAIFNNVSKSRIAEVGPDRACAEWLMRNGAFVRWKDQPQFVEHYNNLPLNEQDKTTYYIEEVNATDASISHYGFPHFSGCEYITRMKFQNCWYIDDRAVAQLRIIAHTLCQLEITKCAELTDKGIASLQNLKRLQDLRLGALQNVKDLPKCVQDLKQALPNCDIYII